MNSASLSKAAAIVFTLTLGLLLTHDRGAAAEAPLPLKIKVAMGPHLANAPLFVAQEEGYFAEQGLAVEFVSMERSQQAVPALIQGEVDVLSGVVSFNTLNAMARGAAIRFVAERGYGDPRGCCGAGLIARKKPLSGNRPKDLNFLKGWTVSYSHTLVAGYLVEKALQDAGLALSDIKDTEIVDPAVAMDALERGAIDAWANNEPWLTRLVNSGAGTIVFCMEQVLPNFSHGLILYGPSLLEKNPEAGRRFMVAYLQGVRRLNLGKTERNLEILAKYTGQDREVLKELCWVAYRPSGRIDVQGILDFEAWGLRKGLIDKLVPPERFWDPAFVEYAVKVLDGAAQPGEGKPVPFETLSKGFNFWGPVQGKDPLQPAYVTITDEQGLFNLLSHSSGPGGKSRGPAGVDFAREVVVAGVDKQEPNGGYDLEITAVVESADLMTVKVTRTSPGPSCLTTQSLTRPFQIIKLARTGKPLSFSVTEIVRQCK